ncbi:unnamed protein product [marine sediment metagenome]|uniref:Uncharacterized protein n=1 Tax=marine sediment metagenome TaxID=412755 RepID=X1A2W4_9ZZZZ
MSDEPLSERLREHGGQITNHLIGKIVTLLDSVIADERQAKAAKDLARTMLWDTENDRGRAEDYILRCYRSNPKVGIFPDWKEKELRDKKTIHES